MRFERREKIEWHPAKDGVPEPTGRFSRLRHVEPEDLPPVEMIRTEVIEILTVLDEVVTNSAVSDAFLLRLANRLSPPLAPDEEDAGFVGEAGYDRPVQRRVDGVLNWLAKHERITKWGAKTIRPSPTGWESTRNGAWWATNEVADRAARVADAADKAAMDAHAALLARTESVTAALAEVGLDFLPTPKPNASAAMTLTLVDVESLIEYANGLIDRVTTERGY